MGDFCFINIVIRKRSEVRKFRFVTGTASHMWPALALSSYYVAELVASATGITIAWLASVLFGSR